MHEHQSLNIILKRLMFFVMHLLQFNSQIVIACLPNKKVLKYFLETDKNLQFLKNLRLPVVEVKHFFETFFDLFETEKYRFKNYT